MTLDFNRRPSFADRVNAAVDRALTADQAMRPPRVYLGGSRLGHVVRHVRRNAPGIAVANDVDVPQTVPRRQHVDRRANSAAGVGGIDDVRIRHWERPLDRQVVVDSKLGSDHRRADQHAQTRQHVHGQGVDQHRPPPRRTDLIDGGPQIIDRGPNLTHAGPRAPTEAAW